MKRLVIVFLFCFFVFSLVPSTSAENDIQVIITGQSLSNQIRYVDEQLIFMGHTARSQRFGVAGATWQQISAYEPPFVDSVAWGGDVVMLVHGETDANFSTPFSEYSAFLHQIQADYSTELGTITPLITDQMSTLGQAGTNHAYISDITRAQWQAANDNQNIYLVGPSYMYSHVPDMVHLTTEGNRWHGEQFAKVISSIESGQGWRPLEPDSITINGRVVTLELHVPVPPLQIDTVTLPAKQNLGFEWWDDGSEMAQIDGLSIDGNTITIHLDRIPTGQNMRLRYAYSGDGLATFWGNIKDSDNTPSYGGFDLSNWLVHFDLPVYRAIFFPMVSK